MNETVSTQTHDFVSRVTTGTQHLCITCAIYQNINFHCTNIMSGEKKVRLLITILLAYIPLKTVVLFICCIIVRLTLVSLSPKL